MIRGIVREVIDYLRDPVAVPKETASLIGDELQFHLDESIREGLENGLSEAEARKQAIERFGNIDVAFRDCAYGAAEGHVRCHRAHLVLTTLLLLAVGALGAWVYRRHAANKDELLLAGDIRGRVLDESSNPIEGAHVLAVVKTWPEDGFQQKAHTGVTRRDGTFLIADVYPEHADYEVQMAVLANGRVLESSYFSRQHGPLPSAEFQLEPSSPLAVRFEGDNGTPLHGVEVFPFQRVATTGAEDTVYFCSAKPIVRRSDAMGEVRLPYFAPGDTATVYLRIPGGEWNTYDFPVGGPEEVVVIKMGKQSARSKLASASAPQK